MSDELVIPEHELFEVYCTLANATEAASTDDPNKCASLAADAKEQVLELRAEYQTDTDHSNSEKSQRGDGV